MKFIYPMIVCAMALAFSGHAVFADDNEVEVKSDKSENPITGTVTETKKYNSKHKNVDGSRTARKVRKVKKTKTDGTVEKKTETETSESND